MLFLKMHAQGNDFVIVDARREPGDCWPLTLGLKAAEFHHGSRPENLPALAKKVCAKHHHLGADGLVILDEDRGRPRMTMLNPDGSEAETCGNALCCLGTYLLGAGESGETTIETLAGPVEARWRQADDFPLSVCLGKAAFEGPDLPETDGDGLIRREIVIGEMDKSHGVISTLQPVSMGNPHGVIFTKDFGPGLKFGRDAWELGMVGFPKGANISLVTPLSPREARIRVHERGAGLTLACGSAACAALASGVRRGLLESPCLLHFPGGDVRVSLDDQERLWYAGRGQLVAVGRALV